MVFCYIPKIACSQWQMMFITLTGKVNTSLLNLGNVHKKYRSKLKFLSGYSLGKRKIILEKYKKYIVVRNPLERILSAYRNKLVPTGTHYQFGNIRKIIVKRYRANTSPNSEGEYVVNFLEFVKFLIDEKPEYYNSHWRRYTSLCLPCVIKYDFVGKYETINRDADFILKEIGVPPNIRFPQRSETYKTVATVKTFEKFYSQIPTEYIRKLMNIYQSDYDLFGYPKSLNLQNNTISLK
ncbi:carbohydrate sulfotransferase 14-like [Pecten maximus]|uniref:carbohydrate sulfotransferase 14-like n=1 Tax=Pecten maximus TaxID=6579 RepID=UPI001458E4DB|nr:carbohydrate sulfotransferase 14-like [Pecten maximus]